MYSKGKEVSLCRNCNKELKTATPIRSQNIRFCWYCGKENPWPLDEDQAPIGYNFDREQENKDE